MKQILLFLICLFPFQLFAQESTLQKAESLVEQKKYNTAIKVLNEADSTNQDPDIVLTKTDIYLNYFAQSFMHKMFALKDLEPDEMLHEVRSSEGNFEMFGFDVDSMLTSLIKQYPENYKLHKKLGEYYHDVHLKYNGRWLEPDSVIVDKFAKYYETAYQHEVYDYWSCYGIGYSRLFKNDFEEAIPFLKQSTELNATYPSSFYNLAYAYYYTGKFESAIDNAINAMELYESSEVKSDAARLTAAIYEAQGNKESAYKYYKKANEIYSNDYYNLKPLLNLAITLEKEEYLQITKDFYSLDSDNPTIYNDLEQVFFQNNRHQQLLEFYKEELQKNTDDDRVMGNLYFYLSSIYHHQKNFSEVEKKLKKARTHLARVLNEDHRVFQIIDQRLEEL